MPNNKEKPKKEDKLKKNRFHYYDEQKLSTLGLFTELPTFIILFISALGAHSLIVWLSFIESLAAIINYSFVAVLSRKLKNNLKYEYNYGIGKLEALAALFCDMVVIIGLGCIAVVSVFDLYDPVQPSDLVIYVVILKMLNVFRDVRFIRKQNAILKERKNRMFRSRLSFEIRSLMFDSVALVTLFLEWLLRDYPTAWYFSPILCLLISAYIFSTCILRIRQCVLELSDRTLPEEDQLKLLKILVAFYDEYTELYSVNSHRSGEWIYIHLHMAFAPETEYKQIKALQEKIAEKVRQEIGICVVSIVIADHNLRREELFLQ